LFISRDSGCGKNRHPRAENLSENLNRTRITNILKQGLIWSTSGKLTFRGFLRSYSFFTRHINHETKCPNAERAVFYGRTNNWYLQWSFLRLSNKLSANFRSLSWRSQCSQSKTRDFLLWYWYQGKVINDLRVPSSADFDFKIYGSLAKHA